ncbi:beta-1,4-galactosyltransferase 1-like isoform X1 [Spea bombifrons]|uniref:beta-1,4-galactosyltransferase 1-like isoform X1 n=1 Tax=Spea bombifrons TaxID=233779 RepID=UPI00234BDB66|nr:beta-1,4-galactosyltransferase 1-like isoform X1 [Spea bombifrons]
MMSWSRIFALLLALSFIFTFTVLKSTDILGFTFDKMKIKGSTPHENIQDTQNKFWINLKNPGNISNYKSVNYRLPLCNEIPPSLHTLTINTSIKVTFEKIIAENTNVQYGGHGKPESCQAHQKIAIVIPYRNREPHLKMWLYNMHPFLQKQQADYGIYVVEQSQNTTFNRAKLMNIGYTEALKDYDYNCFIFSDVDIIPMDLRNLYRCSKNPRHLANAVDKFDFRLPYETIFGGVVAFTKEQFLRVNGFSNDFWGWGGEDDELYNRVVAVGMKVERPKQHIARSKMIFHKRDAGNEKTGKSFHLISKAKQRMYQDGLSSLTYNVTEHIKHRLFTKITVDIGTL